MKLYTENKPSNPKPNPNSDAFSILDSDWMKELEEKAPKGVTSLEVSVLDGKKENLAKLLEDCIADLKKQSEDPILAILKIDIQFHPDTEVTFDEMNVINDFVDKYEEKVEVTWQFGRQPNVSKGDAHVFMLGFFKEHQ